MLRCCSLFALFLFLPIGQREGWGAAAIFRLLLLGLAIALLGLLLAALPLRVLRGLLGGILGLLGRSGGHDAVVMLRMLKIVLSHDAVAAGIGVAGELQIFLLHLTGRAAKFDFRTLGIKGA